MTASEGDREVTIPDEAVGDYVDAEATARVVGLQRGLRGWSLRQHEVRAGLAAALPLLTADVRADQRVRDAAEFAAAIRAVAVTAPNEVAGFAYDHAAALVEQLRVPDCGDQYHGADGGPCARCGFDVAEMAPPVPAQIASDASGPAEGRSGGTGTSESVSGLRIGRDGPLRPPVFAAGPRTAAQSPAASPDQPDAAETSTNPADTTQED